MGTPLRVTIVGSGNWGSAIAKVIGGNVASNQYFESRVPMYVYEEMFQGRKLSEMINADHENKKYLPGIKLPENVVAITDLGEAVQDADIVVFVMPHQFLKGICSRLVGKVKKTAIGLSLIKGFDIAEGGGLALISDVISGILDIPCHVLMGANLAAEVAEGQYCEATIGARNLKEGMLLKKLIQTDYFRIVVVDDAAAVELCGALKNIVAVGAGIADGLGYGDNTKAAVIRLGLMEMIKFVDVFFSGTRPATFLESCGIADLVTTCYGGRNRKVAEAFVKSGKTIDELETEMLNGQKVQGPPTAAEVYFMLQKKGMEDKFPMFMAIHKILTRENAPESLITSLKNHPVHVADDSDYVRPFYIRTRQLSRDESPYFAN